MGRTAENCAQYLAKGRPVGVQGKLTWREWDAQDGTKRQAVEVVADNVQFLGGRDGGEGGGQQFVPAGAAQSSSADFPTAAADDDIPVLGDTNGTAENPADTQAPRFVARPGTPQELPLLQGQGRRGRLQEPEPTPALHLGEGKIRNRRITGACRRHQRQVAVAVKRAREMALLPYVEPR